MQLKEPLVDADSAVTLESVSMAILVAINIGPMISISISHKAAMTMMTICIMRVISITMAIAAMTTVLVEISIVTAQPLRTHTCSA